MKARVLAARANLTPETIRDINMHYTTGALPMRREMEIAGVVHFGCELIRREESNFPIQVRLSAWRWLQNYVIIDDLDNPLEVGMGSPIQVCQGLNALPLAAMELKRSMSNPHIVNAVLSFVAWCAQDEACIPELIKLGVHQVAIANINQGDSNLFLDQSMAVIRSLTSREGETRQALIRDGALTCMLPFLRHLDEREVSEVHIRRGFRAGSVLLRLGENSALAQQVIRGNPMLLKRTLDVLTQVLNVGPTATVYNMGINPHLITMDLLALAKEKENLALLTGGRVLPVLLHALDCRGDRNPQLVKDVCLLVDLLAPLDSRVRSEFLLQIYPRLAKLVHLQADDECKRVFTRMCDKYATPITIEGGGGWRSVMQDTLKRLESMLANEPCSQF
ncbi:hypothetical protein BASA81_008459 [Batrachochytrium salamandrivorans]|nr:hypothetical protein BASA81_008459 [Batrachochytrium salamandrivorans]